MQFLRLKWLKIQENVVPLHMQRLWLHYDRLNFRLIYKLMIERNTFTQLLLVNMFTKQHNTLKASILGGVLRSI